MKPIIYACTLAIMADRTAGIPLRDDMGNISMTISTSSPDAQRYFNQGLRFSAAFKFDFAAESQLAALDLDPDCAMCNWGLAMAYGQNINDALVMTLEPEFLANQPLAFKAVTRAKTLLDEDAVDCDSGCEQRARDEALVNALLLKFRETKEEYVSCFEDGLPSTLNLAYAKAMDEAAARSDEEAWPDHPMVLVLAADAWMNTSPWDYWEDPHTMRPDALKARVMLERALDEDPNNPWAIHLYIHLMEAGSEAEKAFAPAQRLQFLTPGAPHLQHMPSHVEFRTGAWHKASEANIRAVALPDSDAPYPDHNIDMLMWSLGVEGRKTESRMTGKRLAAFATPLLLDDVQHPLLPPERILAQQSLHLAAFADWDGTMSLPPPPEDADYPMAAYRYARRYGLRYLGFVGCVENTFTFNIVISPYLPASDSLENILRAISESLAFIAAKDWKSYEQEQPLITAGLDRMEQKNEYYGVYPAPQLTKILDVISRAEALRAGVSAHLEYGVVQGANERTGEAIASRSFEVGNWEWIKGGNEGDVVPAGEEELSLLRQAVELADDLGYDEPPNLPVLPRLQLGAALLRAQEDPHEAALEALSTFEEMDASYPKMGRTLLGLARASFAVGKEDEAEHFVESFMVAWQYSEVWLEDSAHVGGELICTVPDDCHGLSSNVATIQPRERYTTIYGAFYAAVAGVVSVLLALAARRVFQRPARSDTPATAATRDKAGHAYQSMAETESLVSRENQGPDHAVYDEAEEATTPASVELEIFNFHV